MITLISAIVSSSVLILVILVLRKLFRGKVGNGILYALWLIVAVRLILPAPEFLFEELFGIDAPQISSSVSVMNMVGQLDNRGREQREEISEEKAEEEKDKTLEQKKHLAAEKNSSAFQREGTEEEDSGKDNLTADKNVQSREENVSGIQIENEAEDEEQKTGKGFIFEGSFLMRVTVCVWMFGCLLLLAAQVIFERRFRRALTEGRKEIEIFGQRVYRAGGISTPLLFRSRGFTTDIYIPEHLLQEEKLVFHGILHENMHRKHGDIWWGYLRNLLVAVYWFHPLVWVAAICSKRDSEYACDSSVMRQMNQEERISYGNSLLSLVQIGGEGNLFSTATEMRVRKSEMEERIIMVKRGISKSVLATVLAVLVVVVVGVSAFTYAKTASKEQAGTQAETEEASREQTGTKEETQAETKEASREQTGSKAETQAETENTSKEQGEVQREEQENTETEEVSELTMEELIKCYHNNEFSKWTRADISKYSNLSETQEDDPDVLSREYKGKLSYQGADYGITISLLISIDDENDLGMLDSITLGNEETEEYRLIYSGDEEFEPRYTISPEEFLQHDRILDGRITYTLPEELLTTKDSYSIGFVGRLFYWDANYKYRDKDIKFPDRLYGIPETCLWSSAGGLMETNQVYYIKDEKKLYMNLIDYRGNGRYAAKEDVVREFKGGKLQNIAGCENMTSIQGLIFTKGIINNKPTWFDKRDAGNLTEKKMKSALFDRKLWIVSVMDTENREKDDSMGYVFFFDAEKYTKKQMIALAKSVHIK